MDTSDIVPPEFELWGEIADEERNVISEDVLGTLIRGAVKQEDPKLKLPVVEDDDEDSFPLPKRLCKQNEYVLETIVLNEHAKAVEILIEEIEDGKTEFSDCPPLPKLVKQPKKTKPNVDDKKNVLYNFEMGRGPEFPVIDTNNIDKMLEKAVLVTVAESGFNKAKNSSVCVLIDVARYVLTKICRLLHMFSQPDVMKGRTQYKDPLEKTLQLLGMNGISDVVRYHQKNVIQRREAAKKKSVDLINHYNFLVNKIKEHAAIQADVSNSFDSKPSPIGLHDETIIKPEPGFQMLFDLKTEPQPGPSTSHDLPLGASAKTFIKKRISSNILQNRTKKSKTDT